MDRNHWLNEWRNKTLILRIENDIMSRTGLTKEELKQMDIGDIERKLGIQAKNPYKKHGLYKFVSQEIIKKREDAVTKILNEHG